VAGGGGGRRGGRLPRAGPRRCRGAATAAAALAVALTSIPSLRAAQSGGGDEAGARLSAAIRARLHLRKLLYQAVSRLRQRTKQVGGRGWSIPRAPPGSSFGRSAAACQGILPPVAPPPTPRPAAPAQDLDAAHKYLVRAASELAAVRASAALGVAPPSSSDDGAWPELGFDPGLNSHLAPPAPPRVLKVGCGTPRLLPCGGIGACACCVPLVAACPLERGAPADTTRPPAPPTPCPPFPTPRPHQPLSRAEAFDYFEALIDQLMRACRVAAVSE
jgi:hypothetical protein